MGSVLSLASWAVLMGPITYAKHLVSGPRLPFTAAYFASIFMTLYFAVAVSLPSRRHLLNLSRLLPTLSLSASSHFSAPSELPQRPTSPKAAPVLLRSSRGQLLTVLSTHSGRTPF